MKQFILMFAIIALITSCKTQSTIAGTAHIPQSTNHTDSVRQSVVQVRVDSVYVCDSIYIREHGDTVYVDKWHVRWSERSATKADTVYVTQRETKVEIPPPERYVPKFYKWCTGIFLALLASSLAWLVWRVVKFIYLKR